MATDLELAVATLVAKQAPLGVFGGSWYNYRSTNPITNATALLVTARGARQPIGRLSVSQHTTPQPSNTRFCRACQQDLPLSDFGIARGVRDGRPFCRPKYLCKKCTSKYETRRVANNKPVIPETKVCARCKAEKPASAFNARRSGLDGLQSYCKDCQKAKFASFYTEQIAASPDYHKLRYAKNRKVAIARARVWQKRNPEKHREIQRVAFGRRRARLAAAEGSFTVQEWEELKEKYGHKCLRCGESKPLTVDHVVPISLGGSNSIENIQPLCAICNASKNAKAIDYRPKGDADAHRS